MQVDKFEALPDDRTVAVLLSMFVSASKNSASSAANNEGELCFAFIDEKMYQEAGGKSVHAPILLREVRKTFPDEPPPVLEYEPAPVQPNVQQQRFDIPSFRRRMQTH